MILVGNQRGGAKNLALHLLKDENDHVSVHELRGFASDNLTGALNESYAISRGTRCTQFLFSLSLNPPPHERVRTEDFEAAIERAEAELGLGGQPRAIVFHEKEGRRHAHAVWSRIDVEEMKAIQLSFTKRKLTELSRELYIEHQWKMPRGLMRSEERDPRNFSLEEWQQAKRAERDPREVKTVFQDCWAVSDNRAAFMQALEERGYKLAKGDRRGFVAVDMKGEPFAVSKWVGVKTKDVRALLGEPDDLPGIEQRKQEFDREIAQRLKHLRAEEERRAQAERQRAEEQRRALVQRQREERAQQAAALKTRWDREAAERQQRFNRGLRGMLDRMTGRAAHVREQNLREALDAVRRDRAQSDELIFRHLHERRALDRRGRETLRVVHERQRELDVDIQRHEPPRREIKPEFARASEAGPDPPDREARRAAFVRARQEQAPSRARERGPRRDFER